MPMWITRFAHASFICKKPVTCFYFYVFICWSDCHCSVTAALPQSENNKKILLVHLKSSHQSNAHSRAKASKDFFCTHMLISDWLGLHWGVFHHDTANTATLQMWKLAHLISDSCNEGFAVTHNDWLLCSCSKKMLFCNVLVFFFWKDQTF